MNSIPVNQNVIPLLQGLKPYLSTKSQVLTDGVLGLIKVVSSDIGQDAVKSMSKVFTASGKDDKVITINTAAGPITFSLGLAFTLFLILILLILSGNLLAIGYGMMDAKKNEVEEEIDITNDAIV